MKCVWMRLAVITALLLLNGLAGPQPADAAWNDEICWDYTGEPLPCCIRCNNPFCDYCEP
jgi:hypothetical protein